MAPNQPTLKTLQNRIINAVEDNGNLRGMLWRANTLCFLINRFSGILNFIIGNSFGGFGKCTFNFD